ncbi:hypothetical protein BZB76_1076 [Actinomadura pelletieri DSM 43383]|uniref:DUF6924 domain-containing protein n=1 Tax=Actinomadura pelletieri DSM 43383 TaxID=1120940 RepID=A0A495QZF6_9ACTN|nr:hypothetical protein BZB76_1076 [Actinomadura pelletieri DSM 43383]
MTPLPKPGDLTSLVVRTDFSDDMAWNALKAAIEASDSDSATYVNDPAYAGVTVQEFVDTADTNTSTYLFLADATTMTEDQRPLLAVDLFGEPGRTFRLPPRWYGEISANLCIANLDFADYADATDESGTFRGFGED